MARQLSDWQRLVKKVQDQLPRDATPQERGRAMRRASALYRGRASNPVVANPVGGLVKLLVYGAIAYAGYKALSGRTSQSG